MFLYSIYIMLAVLYLAVIIFYLYTFYAMFSGAPFVPTDKKRVRKMIELADLKSNEVMMDFGSGDGRMVFAAAKTGAKCIGVEINPLLFYWSKAKRKFKRARNTEFIREDLWRVDLSKVDVLTLYFISHKMEKLKQKVKKEMKPGSRIISYAFTFPDWQYSKKDGKLYLYEV